MPDETVRLEMTCGACPEQYDAYIGENKVGYLRLRHGYFTVEVPCVFGRVVYEAYTMGDGAFDASEREFHLIRAKKAILTDWKSKNE